MGKKQEELNRTFPALQSDELTKKSQNFTACKKRIIALFVPTQEGEKFAVLDTSYIRKYPQKLADIQQARTVIFSKTVLDELDYQKEKIKKELNEAKEAFKQTSTDETSKKLDEITEKIKEMDIELKKLEDKTCEKQVELKSLQQGAKVNGKKKHKAKQNQVNLRQQSQKALLPSLSERGELEREISDLKEMLSEARNTKSELNKEKLEVEKTLNKQRNEKDQLQKKVQQLEKAAAEIREANRKIDELKLATHTEMANSELLAMLQKEKCLKTANGDNDDKILAVATYYKLNDLIFYTDDKSLKNKATSIGIKIS